ncbi:hypothetical protein ACR6C2_01285 [Streptomyces sp. INA 01156]
MSFFRWVVALGLVLFGASLAVYMAVPEDPETKQIDLTVLSEKPDGSCTVSWADPYAKVRREGPYQCEPDRDPCSRAAPTTLTPATAGTRDGS